VVSKDTRVTIMLDEELAKKIRVKQAKLIAKSKNSVSFSKVLNEVLSEGFKKIGYSMTPNSKNYYPVVVKFKFRNDEKFVVKTVTMDVYEELKKAPLIEYCELVN